MFSKLKSRCLKQIKFCTPFVYEWYSAAARLCTSLRLSSARLNDEPSELIDNKTQNGDIRFLNVEMCDAISREVAFYAIIVCNTIIALGFAAANGGGYGITFMDFKCGLIV